jgi:hypothetical protein
MSYMGHLDFGIVADRDQVRDVWCVMDWLREGLAELEPEPAADTEEPAPAGTT